MSGHRSYLDPGFEMISSLCDRRRISAECHSLVEAGHFWASTPRWGSEALAYLVTEVLLS
jgi:hypothetical protein